MADLIEPRTLKGFRDYLPSLMIPREHLLEQARQVYRSYGFAPIDTPALEYAEILLRQGRRGVGQADLPLHGSRRPRRRPALRPDRAVRALRRPVHRPARHAVQALSHGPGLARREHRARPLPRILAVRFRHHRHHVQRRRHRDGPGHSRPDARPRFRALRDSRQQSPGPQRPAGGAGPGRAGRCRCCAPWTSCRRSAAEAVMRRDGREGRRRPRPGRARARPGRTCRAATRRSSTAWSASSAAMPQAAEGIAPAARTARRGPRRPASPRSGSVSTCRSPAAWTTTPARSTRRS